MEKGLDHILLAFLLFASIGSTNAAMAAKPLDVIALSNAYPSGPHFNLNILTETDCNCDGAEGGNSVSVSEHGDSTISYVRKRRSSLTELMVLDKCAEAFDGDAAQVQLPYKSKGFWVYASVRAKSNNGHNIEENAVILSPNLMREACNNTDSDKPGFSNCTGCPDDSLLILGLVVGSNVYKVTDAGLVRLKDSDATTKGKSKGVDISDLFKWTGYIFDASLDMNSDGIIDINDVPSTYDTDGILDISEDEYNIWLADRISDGNAKYHEEEWIYNVTDLVVTDPTIDNDNARLLKARFYPVATTSYE